MAEQAYTREEVFEIPWQRRTTASGIVRRLYLDRVDLEFRIIPDGQRYKTMTRWKEETPWVLGYHSTVAEAKHMVLHGILFFQLYHTGTWSNQPFTKKQLYMQERMKWQ
jgi:hypothetical protein